MSLFNIQDVALLSAYLAEEKNSDGLEAVLRVFYMPPSDKKEFLSGTPGFPPLLHYKPIT